MEDNKDDFKALIKALVKFQGKRPKLVKNAVAGKGTKFSYSYATLEAVIETIRPSLFDCGLCFTQHANEMGVRTILYHEDGASIETTYHFTSPYSDMQKYGSAVTYAKRYSLLALLGISAEDDDDGVMLKDSNKTPTKNQNPVKKQLSNQQITDAIAKATTASQLKAIHKANNNNPNWKVVSVLFDEAYLKCIAALIDKNLSTNPINIDEISKIISGVRDSLIMKNDSKKKSFEHANKALTDKGYQWDAKKKSFVVSAKQGEKDFEKKDVTSTELSVLSEKINDLVSLSETERKKAIGLLSQLSDGSLDGDAVMLNALEKSIDSLPKDLVDIVKPVWESMLDKSME